MKINLQKMLTLVFPWLILISCGSEAPETSQKVQPSKKSPSIGNNVLPEIVSIQLTPKQPTLTDTIQARVKIKGKPLDSFNFRYQWVINGKANAGEIQSDLWPGSFIRGDTVLCRVNVYSAFQEGNPVESESITIVNTAPIIGIKGFEPEKPGRNTGLKILVDFEDPDGDAITINYIWYIDDEPVDGVNEPFLEGKRLTKKQKVWAKVEYTDDYISLAKNTDKIIVSNSPPEIISSPPTLYSGTKKYTYQVKAQDPDGDPIKFTAEGLPGVEITPDGLLTWLPIPESQGLNLLKITAKDNDGASSTQEIELEIFVEKVKKDDKKDTSTQSK